MALVKVADRTLHEPMSARNCPSFSGATVTFTCNICGESWDREATPENAAQANRHGAACLEQERAVRERGRA